MKTKVIILPQEQLTDSQKQYMWAIYQGFYNYSEAYFMERLSRNTHFSLYLNGEKIVGFTGLRIDKTKLNGRRHLLLYFGQTVILREYRGQSLIQATSLMLAVKYWKDILFSNAWYWYDALSYKAYLVSAKTAVDYFPSYRNEMTPLAQQVREFAGANWYGESYCTESGTVSKASNYLNDATVKIFPSDLEDPDVAFFAKSNPQHGKGHGLLTFVPINSANLICIAQRCCNRLFNNMKQTQKVRKSAPKPELANSPGSFSQLLVNQCC